MQLTVITLFPEIFSSVFSASIIKRGQKEKLLKINILDLRSFGIGKHKSVDDKPYGGGTGMVIRVDALEPAIRAAKMGLSKEAVVLLDPKGQKYNQKMAESFLKIDHLILICGRYEGFDERIRDFVDYEVSIGDYVLSGGEIGAMAIIDSVSRLIPGVLKKQDATTFESFGNIGDKTILEYPHYTRPPVYKGKKVPKVLLTGNFKHIEEYRLKKAKELTSKRRPDLI